MTCEGDHSSLLFMCQREAQLVTTHVVFSAQSKSSVMSACPLPYSDCLVITLIVHVNDCPSITPSCIQNVRRAHSRYKYKSIKGELGWHRYPNRGLQLFVQTVNRYLCTGVPSECHDVGVDHRKRYWRELNI